MWRARCHSRPNESRVDRSALIDLLIVEFPLPVSELPDHGILLQDSIGPVGPINTPLARLRIVKTQRQSLDMHLLVCAFHIHFFHLATAVQYLSTNGSPVKFNPFSGTN